MRIQQIRHYKFMGEKRKKINLGIKDINLNSSDWCDIVFEGRNKSYGAYKMRQTSGKRLRLAFLIVVLFFSLFAFLPKLIDTVISYKFHDQIVEVRMLSDIKFEKEEMGNMLPLEETPPPPLIPAIIPTKTPLEIPKSAELEIIDAEELIEEPEMPPVVENQAVQAVIEEKTERAEENSEKYTIDELYTAVEEMPAFRGGEPGLRDYLSKNLRYPTIAMNKKIQGSVICTFIIDKDGSVTHPEITQEADSLMNKETLRVVRSMPKWKPGIKQGTAVRVKYTLPVIFSLH